MLAFISRVVPSIVCLSAPANQTSIHTGGRSNNLFSICTLWNIYLPSTSMVNSKRSTEHTPPRGRFNSRHTAVSQSIWHRVVRTHHDTLTTLILHSHHTVVLTSHPPAPEKTTRKYPNLLEPWLRVTHSIPCSIACVQNDAQTPSHLALWAGADRTKEEGVRAYTTVHLEQLPQARRAIETLTFDSFSKIS